MSAFGLTCTVAYSQAVVPSGFWHLPYLAYLPLGLEGFVQGRLLLGDRLPRAWDAFHRSPGGAGDLFARTLYYVPNQFITFVRPPKGRRLAEDSPRALLAVRAAFPAAWGLRP